MTTGGEGMRGVGGLSLEDARPQAVYHSAARHRQPLVDLRMVIIGQIGVTLVFKIPLYSIFT